MATRKFALNTEPHIAEIGEYRFEFQPEVMGDEFLDSYSLLQETGKRVNVDLADTTNIDLSDVREVTVALRVFLASLMLPASAAEFTSWQVRAAGGKVLSSHRTPDEAHAAAAETKGKTTVVDGGVRLPDRVLVELMEWCVELYGGGQRPPMSSNASAQASLPPGRPGRATSRSRG